MTPNEMDSNIICPNCEEEIIAGEVCPECGWSGLSQKVYSLELLEIGVVLKDRYEVIENLSVENKSTGILAGGINCYLMVDKESQRPVVAKEAATPVDSEKSTKWEGVFETDIEEEYLSEEIDFVSDTEAEDSTIWFEEDISTEKQVESAIESDEVLFYSSDFQQTDLPENESFTSELDASDSREFFDQHILDSEQQLPFERIQQERSILEELKYPTIVKIIDYFEDDGRAYLVEDYFEGGTLWEAWHLPDTSMTQQIDWLIQLCQALAKVHAAGILYNAVTSDRLKVSKEKRIVLTDFSNAIKIPLAEKHQQGVDFYVAPELVLNPETVDVRADLYSLGVMFYELLLGRHLTDEDFEFQFILKPLQDYLPNLNPEINRFLLKLTNHNPDMRFTSKDDIEEGNKPVVSLQRNLLQLKQNLTQSTLVLGSQTNIGMRRENNEDNLWAQNLSYRNADGYIPLGLFIVADGMGGAEAGEVASKIVIRTISGALLPSLMEFRQYVDDDHSEDFLSEIKAAIIRANNEIIEQTEQIPPWRGMGSTVTLAAVVGMRVYVGHVGDSRLYLINRKEIHQKTTDHSIVSRLLQIGAITAEEAETHPQREVLLKAVGSKSKIEPDTFSFTIEQGDILLLCSDGLTKHQEDSEIHNLVMDSSSPQQACDSLINHANLCGGEDNTTVIVVQILDTKN